MAIEFPFDTFQECVDRMEGEVDDPGAFCKWLYEQAGGGSKEGQERDEELPLKVGVEVKYNGFRMLLVKSGERVGLWADETPDVNRLPRYGGFGDPIGDIPGNFILDGDMAIRRDGERLKRPELMRLMADEPELEEGEEYVFTIFDLPYWNEDLSEQPFHERRERLEEFYSEHLAELDGYELSELRDAETVAELRDAAEWAFSAEASEGAMLKIWDSPYEEGGTRYWFKLKKAVELKVIVLGIEDVEGAEAWNYEGGILLSPGDDWENVKEHAGREYVNLGRTFNTSIEAKVGDILTVTVLEIIPDEEEKTLSWLGARVLDIDERREHPYTSAQVVDIADRAELLIKQELGDEEAEMPRADLAQEFWQDNWMDLFPEGGTGDFTYQMHWSGLDEDEIELAHSELLRTDHSVHGDLRLQVDDESLYGFTVFEGAAEDIRETGAESRLLAIREGDDGLRGQFKLEQPVEWLDVAHPDPLVVEPGGVGATAESWAKFFEVDRGTYIQGVRNRHFNEFFLEGGELEGRFTMTSFPANENTGERAWVLTKPEDQEPMAKTEDLIEEAVRLKEEGHEYLLWAGPDLEPELIDLTEFDPDEFNTQIERANFNIAKIDEELRLIYGIVLEPYSYDTQGDVINKREAMLAAHNYLKDSRLIGLKHRQKAPAVPVESYIAPTSFILGGQKVKEGSWIMVVKVLDDELWDDVKAGKYTGFSAGGFGERRTESWAIDFLREVS